MVNIKFLLTIVLAPITGLNISEKRNIFPLSEEEPLFLDRQARSPFATLGELSRLATS